MRGHFERISSECFRRIAMQRFADQNGSSRCPLPHSFALTLSIWAIFLFAISTESRFSAAPVFAADEPKNAEASRPAVVETVLPKYEEMELPPATELLRSKPFDWIVLKSADVLVTEPVGPRPETLARLQSEYERYIKARGGMAAGEERVREKRRIFQRLQLTLINPGPDQDPDYFVETRLVQRIEYFEDLVLRRASMSIEEGLVGQAYDLLLLVDRRNRENNLHLKESHAARAREEAEAKNDETLRITVPEPPPLKLLKIWPRFDEVYQQLLFKDAELHDQRGDGEAALRLLENLWDHNASYSGLSGRIGGVVDRLIQKDVDRSDFREARHFLNRLAGRDAQHPTVTKWKAELTAQTVALIAEARTVSSEGDASRAASLIDLATRVWPDTPGLKDAHRELIERFQSVRLGVIRLPGEPTTYRFDTPVEAAVKGLTEQLLFEPARVDERGVRYRSSLFESWEPTDLGRQVEFTVRMKRADWESRPLLTSIDILNELIGKLDPTRATYDERLAGTVEQVTVQSPSQFTIHFHRLPLRLEALFQFTVPIDMESLALNPDLPAGAMPMAGRQKFYEFERDERRVAYRRVRAQPVGVKTRYVDEIVQLKYDSWDRALQGLLRGEIVAVPDVGLRDVKRLQEDNRFLVMPYALPLSHFILFRPTSAPLRDGQLRRALTLALPREEMLKEKILSGVNEPYARLTATPCPTTSYGHNRLLSEPAYDPQRAAALALTARKQAGGQLAELRMICPPDPTVRAIAATMIEHWRRVGITVRLNDVNEDGEWDLVYRTTSLVEPVTELWPTIALNADAKIEALKPLPERIRRQLLDLERANDWTNATRILRRIETDLMVDAQFIPLWEVDQFFVFRRQLFGLPARMMNAFQDVERWTLQSWFSQETP
ncbi:ABC transporter substrate-binding protein [Schlesneria paludicola]|uniref:ABC transporter substrate-binding protein n=1 Tax=Schlesneria paludicola TaxID=360056 RepID=UPI00029A175A|nr:ABC transporter substrate-binding protein [Schlesneria paludicola]